MSAPDSKVENHLTTRDVAGVVLTNRRWHDIGKDATRVSGLGCVFHLRVFFSFCYADYF